MGSEWFSPFFTHFSPFLTHFSPFLTHFSLLLLKHKGKQQQFTAKMRNVTPTLSAPTPCKTSSFFTGCIVQGIPGIRANSDDFPWKNPQTSIIIRVFQPFVWWIFSVSRRGGRNKGGLKQMRANASKRRQTRTNASKRRGKMCENSSKRKQTQANASKRGQTQTNAYNPLYCGVFTPPFAIPLFLWVFPRKVVRIRSDSRNALYNAPGKEVSDLRR